MWNLKNSALRGYEIHFKRASRTTQKKIAYVTYKSLEIINRTTYENASTLAFYHATRKWSRIYFHCNAFLLHRFVSKAETTHDDSDVATKNPTKLCTTKSNIIQILSVGQNGLTLKSDSELIREDILRTHSHPSGLHFRQCDSQRARNLGAEPEWLRARTRANNSFRLLSLSLSFFLSPSHSLVSVWSYSRPWSLQHGARTAAKKRRKTEVNLRRKETRWNLSVFFYLLYTHDSV